MKEQALNRRNILRAAGATIALPWLESTALFADEPKPGPHRAPKRFACLFWGDGVNADEWTFSGSGSDLKLGPAFPSLEAIKQKVTFIQGLGHDPKVMDYHARAAGILTGVRPAPTPQIRCAVSMDQVMAQHIGSATPIPSLVLTCEKQVSGFHESGTSMVCACCISWSTPTTPLPAELYPSLAFDSLFDSKHTVVRGSILDYVAGHLRALSGQSSHHDRQKIDEYTSSVRDLEIRLQRLQQANESGSGAPSAASRPPAALPVYCDEHAKLMVDILALAFQTDRTRIATLVFANNLSGHIYPFLGHNRDHHSYSHIWTHKPMRDITRFWVANFARLLKKLDAMPEGEGTVLDNSCIMMVNEQWVGHKTPQVPLLLGGGLGGTIATGRSLHYGKSSDRRLSKLYLSIMDRMGVKLPYFGEASERLAEL